MNRNVGWLLVITALAAGWFSYGWPGIVMAVTVVVFWLLLQFGRAMRVMTNAGRRPKGRVPNAVMLHSRLRTGMTMLELLQLTRSLADPVEGRPDTWAWADDGGDSVTVDMPDGKLRSWQLVRQDSASGANETGTPAASP